MRFVIKEIRPKTDWSGDDTEYQKLRDDLLGEDTLPAAPEPKREEKKKVAPELLALMAILGVT